jgi:glycosyltransferase involved in cell wall biosynthesis
VIQDGVNGELFNFFDVDDLSARVIAALADSARLAPIRKRARETIVARYDLEAKCLPAWLDLVKRTAAVP